MSGLEIAALVVPWLLVAGLAFALFQLFGQYGRSLLNVDELRTRVTSVEQRLATQPAAAVVPVDAQPLGLAPGTSAPNWELPDLDGVKRTLGEFLGARSMLLVFFSTTCGFCTQMASRLGELAADGPRVLLVSTGDPDALRALAGEHGWDCDILLDSGEVMTAYGARGTPTGYLIDKDGVIVTELAMGAEALFELHESARSAGTNGHSGFAVRDVAQSRIKRDGLEAGTPAPDFTLPDLKGSSRSLKRFRGKRLLLVFSDVDCGPCQALAPDLVRLHDEHRGNNLEVVMVSRGDAEENRKKAAEYGISFPVLLQKSWEISKDYAMFATPVAYLIDENGMIEKDVAVGADSILQLV